MKWVRVDVNLSRNPKILALLSEPGGFRAAFVYVCALGYIGEQGLDGFLPTTALPFIHGRPREAGLLVKHRLWRHEALGWLIPDWAEYQPTSAEERARGRSARKAACARWHEQDCTCWKDDP